MKYCIAVERLPRQVPLPRTTGHGIALPTTAKMMLASLSLLDFPKVVFPMREGFITHPYIPSRPPPLEGRCALSGFQVPSHKLIWPRVLLTVCLCDMANLLESVLEGASPSPPRGPVSRDLLIRDVDT